MTRQPRTEILTVRLDPNHAARLRMAAAEDGISTSQALRRLVEGYIAGRHEEVGDMTRALDRWAPGHASSSHG